ncbi:mechanosensitive ion channel [Candidatus Nitrosopelagicus sp.]|nr:mechanosensitive ion channel [Candidatus Nitrosopelagicus sp.]
MAEEISEISVGQFDTVSQLIASSVSLQLAVIGLIIGIIVISVVYRKFSFWIKTQKFNHTRPHVARFARKIILPFLAIALISSVNMYIQVFELFDEESTAMQIEGDLAPSEVFAKMLNTLNILVIGYTISQLVPIALTKRDSSRLEREDFEAWREMRGFPDDADDLFHKLYKWIPPKQKPDDLTEEEFNSYLQTDEGIQYLENFRTSRGAPIGSYEKNSKEPYEKWKKSERKKYQLYFEACVTGKNVSGRKLFPGVLPEEIYPIDIWREQKRNSGFESIISGNKPPGHSRKQKEGVPKSAKQVLPILIFVGVLVGVVSWWEVDLIVLATATGGLAFGVGLALKETLENYFSYILIRKDKVVKEGDRIQLQSGYNGYVHKITPRVTYIRHGLNESVAIIPTRQLVSAEIINYTKEIKLVPAVVNVGVSYLNNPRQVTSILVKVGKRAMIEATDARGRHLVRQNRCPYLGENKPSCGCDKDIHVDVTQPVVRFDKFNDSSLDFSMWVYVRDYGAQFKTKSDMRLIMYEEFKKYDIRIPWPIRTVYQGDEKREEQEINQLDSKRNEVMDEYGLGDLGRGEAGDE